MINNEFLEKYPLYRKLEIEDPEKFHRSQKVNIKMYCEKCDSNQTFNQINSYNQIFSGSRTLDSIDLNTYFLIYVCASCQRQFRFFLLNISVIENKIMKIGQYPPWDISIDRDFRGILGDFEKYYKNGLICESQGYGIGAVAYYRRIVEEIIDNLLGLIPDLMGDDERVSFQNALKEVKKTTNTAEKIDLVKDLLPPILRPNDYNPLKILHEELSVNLHGTSDEECMEDAETIRHALEFLVKQVMRSSKEKLEFSGHMKKLLEKKARRIKK